MVAFEGLVEEARGGGGAWVVVPADVVDALGGGGRIPVTATFDGHPYQGSIARYGGQHVIGLLKDIRAAIGKQPGDPVSVTLERDAGTREVAVPDDLAAALAESPDASAAWEQLSYSHRREHVNAILEAKKPETRARRVANALAMLEGGA